VTGATWRVAMRIVAGVGDLVQRTRWSSTGRVLSGQMIERLGDDVCSLHHAQGDEERRFLSLASKPRSMVSWFDLKTKVDGFSRFGLKTGGFGFPSLGLKIVSYNLVIWASKSP
jgi:hypothetical protein